MRWSLRKRRSARLSILLTCLVVAGAVVVAGPQLLAPASAQARDALGADLDAILAQPGLAGADVGLVVRPVDGSEVLYRRGSDRRQQPASNAKLVTSAAALEVLGPDHRFSTTVHTAARRTGPVLNGDLYLRGTGDPTMLAADYAALADTVAASGVRFVHGNLVADDTWFDDVRLGLSWAWDDEPFYYNAQVSALTASPDTDFDAGSIIVRVLPGAAPGAPARVETQPATDYVRIANSAVTGAPGSGSAVSVDREHGNNTIVVTGSIPAGGGAVTEWMAVWEPTGYAAALFRSALSARGVRVLGPTVRGATPPAARVLAERRSIPLRELQVPFMKLSNNLHAEILVKSMGRATSGAGSWGAGRAAVATTLSGLGIDPSRLSLVDGSGLSRMDQISPDQLAALLVGVSARPWFGAWYEALPIAGVPDRMVGGTLRNRMRGTPAERNVHAKTGSLTGVSGLSGYVTAANGQRLVFSMVANNTIGVNVKAIEDAVAVRLAQYQGDRDQRQSASLSASALAEPGVELECAALDKC